MAYHVATGTELVSHILVDSVSPCLQAFNIAVSPSQRCQSLRVLQLYIFGRIFDAVLDSATMCCLDIINEWITAWRMTALGDWWVALASGVSLVAFP